MSSTAKRILIIGPSWVGDMVMAQSLFITLKQQYPMGIIDVLAPAWSLPILERMPEIRRGIAMPVGHGKLALGMRIQLGRDLRVEHYDQAIVLPNSLKSALIPLFASIPERTGWRGEMRYGLLNDIRLLKKDDYPLMVQRFVALANEPFAPLAEKLPQPRLQIDSDNIDELLIQYAIPDSKPILALCPGAEFGPAKRWPEQYYSAVAQHYIELNWTVLLFGSDNDKAVAKTIRDQLPVEQQASCISLAGQTELAQAVDIMSRASAVVSNDSGLMHVAAALGLPLVVVYGSTSPKFTPPLSDNVAVEQLDVDCGPCFERECPLADADRPLKCLIDLSPQRVIMAVDKLVVVA
ncbi:MAG: lipopolysaccharide heptosyltransferase II [Oceanicoccus sp.]